MKWKKVKENNIHSKEQHKYSTFYFCSTFASHTNIYLYLSSPSINPPLPPLRPFFFYLLFMCTKGELGCPFCIERLSMNVPFDRYHTKANTELGRKKKRTSHSFPLSWRYIKCCTRKTVYEKVFFFFQASYIVKEVRCIHLTNLYSLCEQVARSSTPTKQKLNQLKLFF